MALVLALGVAFGSRPAVLQAGPITPSGSLTLSGAASVLFSPVTLADITGDGRQDILVGTSDGKVFAIRYKSTTPYLEVIWSRNLATDFGGPTRIRGAISVGDIDGNGSLEVIVPAGDLDPAGATKFHGGIVALRASNGTPLWVYRTQDLVNNSTGASVPDGVSDAVVSSPALGDLDNDGRLEIAFGGWDFRVHVINSDGQPVAGWPIFVRDSVWSSAALADLDDDGLLEVVIGVDSHEEPAPFNTPNGGCLYAFRGDGQVYWRQCINQVIFSSPAIGDLDGDGQLDIVHGTGEHYKDNAGQPVGNQVYAWRADGTLKWVVNADGIVREGVALANLDGDSQLEVVAGTMTGNLHTWNHNGTVHWTTPVVNNHNLGNSVLGPPVVAAHDTADARPDVFANIYWDTAVHSGSDGARLSAGAIGDSRPGYVTECTASTNAPAIGDIDGDGKLELVSASGTPSGGPCGNTGKLYFWDLTSNATAANTPWPMFGHNAAHTRLYPHANARDATVVSHNLPEMLLPGQQYAVAITLRNTGATAWTAANAALGAVGNSDPLTGSGRVGLNGGESVAPGASRTFNFNLTAPQAEGYYTTDWRMVSDSAGDWFGRTARVKVKVGNQPALQVVTPNGIFPGGMAPPPLSTSYDWWPGAGFHKLTADQRGFYLMNLVGNLFTGGNAMQLWLPGGGYGNQPRDMALGPDGISTFVLRQDGHIIGCDPISCNRGFNPPPPVVANARSFALTVDGKGVYVADGFGNVYRGGNAPALTGAPGLPLGQDLIRRFKLSPNGGYYMMDFYGRVFSGGGAPALAPGFNPQIGQDWARDFELTHDGQGYYLLDRDGRIHHGGAATPLTLNLPPINTSEDIGRDLELLDTRRTLGMLLSPSPMVFLIEGGSRAPVAGNLNIAHSGGGVFNWSIVNQDPNSLEIVPASGSLAAGQGPALVEVRVRNPSTYALGSHTFGLTVTGQSGANKVESPLSVKLVVAAELYRVYLPRIGR